MSLRADKGEAQLRKSGRSGSSGHHRGYSGGGRGGSGGGGGGAHPPVSSASPTSSGLSTSRSIKKPGNGQPAQSRVNTANPISDAAAALNGAYPPASVHGFLDAPAPSGPKPVDTSASSSRVPPKAPPLQTAAGTSDRAPPKTPPKGDASRGFPLQFGSISPGIMNGMQIPARTSSAPPKLDEQKQEQARHDALRALATQHVPAAQKQQQHQTRKDVSINQSNTGESRPPTQTKRDLNIPIPSAPVVAPQKPSVLPVGGMPMSMSYQLPQVPLQFGGPRPQMQSQGVSVSSLQMTMALPVGNPPQAPQQMFIPGIHSHPLQAQAMMHQGQGVGFVPHMGHQMAPQLGNIGVGNLGVGIPPQFSQQQQPGNFGGQRKTTVKITHPDTHEELRLDKITDSYADSSSSGQRPPPNVTPQSQHIPSFASAHQLNYYPPLQQSSYNAPIFFPSTSVPLTSTQMATGAHAQRYNYPVSQGGQVISFMDQSLFNSMPGSKLGPSPHLHGATEAVNLDGLQASAAHAAGQVTMRPPIGSYVEKAGTPSVKISAPVSKAESSMAINTSLGKPVPSVTISTPVNKTVTSVIISKPSSKIEPSVTIRAPVNKTEPTVTISLPVNAAEAPKLSKVSEDTSAAQMQIEVALVSSFRYSKPASEPSADISVPASDICSSVLPAVVSTQIAQPGTSSSVPVTPVGDSGSVVTVTDGRKKDTVRRSESFKDHHKKLSKKDAKQSQQHLRTEASGLGEGTHLSSSKLVKDSSLIDSTRQVSDHSENIQPPTSEGSEEILAPLVADSSISTMILPSPVEAIVSPKVQTSEAVKDQKPDVLSGVMVEKEASEDGSSVCSVAYNQSNDEASIKQSGSSEASSSVCREVGGAMPMNSHSSFSPEESLLVELEQKQEILAGKYEKIEESNDLSLDTSSSKAYSTSTSAESLAKEEGAGAQGSECATVCDLNDGEKQKSATCTEANDISLEVDRAAEESAATKSLESIHVEPVSSCNFTSGDADEDKCPPPDTLSKCEVICSQDVVSIDLGISQTETANLPASISSDSTQKQGTELSNLDTFSVVASGTKGKPSVEPTRIKITGGKKKKRKEIFSKADAAGASDLYNAYKGPEEKQEVAITSESADSSLSVDAKHNVSDKPAATSEEDGPSKTELDDWEDAADISTPKLKTTENGKLVNKHQDEYGGDATSKKYSRDFLLTLAEQCTDLPIGFDIGSDVAVALLNAQGGSSPHPSPGRIIDRPSGGPRGDRRMSAMLDDGKWTKTGGSFGTGGDIRGDGGHGVTITNFRPGQVVNHGVLRNPRGQPSNQFPGGILSAPMHTPASQGGVQRNNIESDRWQRPAGIQRGLIPSPQTPLQVMHKAERKYEIGKVSDEEEGKQRQLKAILNKLTPQNFDKLFAQVIEVNIDNDVTLRGVISQMFDKALMEPTFCEMYANFCFHLADALPDFCANNEKITFKRLLLTKCQEEFERGEREQEEANKIEEEGEIKQSEKEREEKRLRVRRRMLGNIRLIGELFKKKMLTERIMHSCINKLLGQQQNPDEEDLEALCKLMSTIGEMIDHSKAKGLMDAYYDMMQKLSINQKLSSRVRFLLRDAIDLRKNKWQQRRKVEGPKTIEEVHRDAAQERQAQPSRSSRGPVISSAGRRGQPVDYGPRGSNILTSPSSQQIGSVRNLPSQNRGYAQDIRLADRHQFDNRAVPLQQRSVNSDSITLGPQGGLARGMSIRGQPLISNIPSEMHPSISDPHRIPSGSNGYGAISDRAPYSSKEEMMHRSAPDRSSGDHILGRSTAVPLSSGRPIISSQNMPSDAKTLSEESLREKSISAIREFYSAKDVEEVVLCVKELNTPGYHPSMVSLWVTDSFERKDMERNLLAKLLVKLSKAHNNLLSQMQLIQGFESVLSSLEDAVNDAPRAAEFLGRILAEVIVENVVSLRDIGKLIHEGGEEPGRLLQIGLASEVLAGILEFIRTEKGDSVLYEIRTISSLKLEDFRPPHPMKSKKLDTFLEG